MSQNSPRETLKILYSILDIDQNITGMDYLKILIANIAKELNVKYVFIGHAVEPDKTSVQTDIVWADNDYHENFLYDLAKTPCENVITGKRVCIHKEKVTRSFPEDLLLAQMGVESYIGAPVLTRKSDFSGLLVILDDKPIEDEIFFSAVVELLAMRVDTEMERYYIEEKLKKEVSKRTAQLETANTQLKDALNDLKEANITKEKFFSIIAHDLMNPFNVILSFSTLLVDYFERYSREDIKEMVGEIATSSQKLHDLLDNLLQWCMSQTDKLEYNPQLTNVNQLVSNCASLFKSNAQKKNITISEYLPVEQTAFFDEDMITTVIRNLLSNAIKFTKPGGNIKINCFSSDNHIEIEVIDDGVGMSKEDIDKLFKIDVKLSTTGTSGEEGTGLGIMLCKEFIEKNSGTFQVESKAGKGSRFSFRLPLKEGISLSP